jgi:hypothetical protein
MSTIKKQTHLTEFQTAEYIDAIASDNLELISENIKQHIASCDDCRNTIMEAYTFSKRHTSNHEDDKVGFSIKKTFGFSQFQYGLAAVIGLILIPLSFLMFNNSKIDSSFITPLPAMEFLVNQQFRAESITIHSPIGDDWKHNPISFLWEGHSNFDLFVSIVNNKGETIATNKAVGCSYVFNETLSPGLYYWKLETNEDLIHVGKFLVK